MPGILGLAFASIVAVVVFAPLVSRRLRHRRVAPAAGAAVVSPVRSPPAGGMAVPVIEVQPSTVMTGPFAYDNGVLTGTLPGEDIS